MSNRSKNKTERKALAVRIISMALAILMVLSVVMAAVWQW